VVVLTRVATVTNKSGTTPTVNFPAPPVRVFAVQDSGFSGERSLEAKSRPAAMRDLSPGLAVQGSGFSGARVSGMGLRGYQQECNARRNQRPTALPRTRCIAPGSRDGGLG